jgi:hypothetical protein
MASAGVEVRQGTSLRTGQVGMSEKIIYGTFLSGAILISFFTLFTLPVESCLAIGDSSVR